jgi:hypothetical protein
MASIIVDPPDQLLEWGEQDACQKVKGVIFHDDTETGGAEIGNFSEHPEQCIPTENTVFVRSAR